MISRVLNLLFPSRCPLCGSLSDDHLHNSICSACFGSIERYKGPSCRACGVPTVSSHTGLCKSCTEDPPPISAIVYYGVYEGALREAIHLLKYGGIRRLGKPLSALPTALPFPDADVIVPVPLHRRRLLAREFNQTAVLGHYLSKSLGIPLSLTALIKTRETPRQTEMTGRERLRTLSNSFAVTGDVTDASVLLVDDVITTTATVRECASTLRQAGVKQVTAVALARSRPKE
ncbi:MAG: ComF family protein [Chloroflexota bacterium]